MGTLSSYNIFVFCVMMIMSSVFSSHMQVICILTSYLFKIAHVQITASTQSHKVKIQYQDMIQWYKLCRNSATRIQKNTLLHSYKWLRKISNQASFANVGMSCITSSIDPQSICPTVDCHTTICKIRSGRRIFFIPVINYGTIIPLPPVLCSM